MPTHRDLQHAALRYDAALGLQPPTFTDAMRLEAEHAVAGEIHYTDGQYVHIGRADIDWTGSHIAEHVWKERPKRFLYLPPLMAGYAATRDERYAEAARDYLTDWMRAHPAGPEWTMARYDNGLNLGVRVPFFAQALAAFADSPAWDDAFGARVLADIGCELRYIGAHLSPKGNFRMKQAMTLIECALRLPQHPDAGVWRQQGVAVMNDAARRQVLADGVHVECTAGYHGWMTRLFRDCLQLQQCWPELGFAFSVEMVAAMFDYCLAVTRPNGSFCGMHDSEGAWEGTHENKAAEERITFRRHYELPESLPPIQQLFPAAGQAFLRDGWGADATYLTFDATRWGGAHCHLSRNAVSLHAFGRSLLVDPGRISYEMRNPLGPYAKSTRAHNTVTLNGWNQFTTNPDDFRAFTAPGFACVSSRYTGGYWPAPYGWWFYEGMGHGLAATHTRHLFWVHGHWCVVIDEVTRWNESGRGPAYESPSLELNWQFSPGPLVVDAARRRVVTGHPDANLLLCVAGAPENAVLELHEGETDPPRGWVRDYRRFAGLPAPQLSVACHPWEGHMETLVTLFVPFCGTEVPEVEAAVTLGNVMHGQPYGLTLTWADGARETLAWTAGLESMLGATDMGETDGVLLYRREGGAIAAVDATYAPGPPGTAVILTAPGAQGF
jgi:hypothetical protein